MKFKNYNGTDAYVPEEALYAMDREEYYEYLYGDYVDVDPEFSDFW